VLGTCIKYLKNQEDGQDAAADIFESLCRRLDDLHIERFAPWLHTVTRNHCLKLLDRRLRPHLENIAEFNPNVFVDREETAPHQERLLEQLSTAIDRLNDDQRRCIILFFLEQRSYKEIAAQTSYDLKQVKSHIQNGKRNLKIALSVES
jgi:RNA polymerase sigma-70 factor (ECF subfamily)